MNPTAEERPPCRHRMDTPMMKGIERFSSMRMKKPRLGILPIVTLPILISSEVISWSVEGWCLLWIARGVLLRGQLLGNP